MAIAKLPIAKALSTGQDRGSVIVTPPRENPPCAPGSPFLLAFCIFSASFGAPPKFTKGEKVEVDFGFNPRTAEVVRVLPNGWVMVKQADANSGIVTTGIYPPDHVKKIRKSAKGATSGQHSSKTANKNSLRTWSDTTGNFTIRARFQELSDGKVRLEQEDGTTVAIPLAKLSDADQKQAQESALKTTPFKAEEKAKPDEDQTDDNADTPRGDWSDVKLIEVTEPGAWDLKPDAAEPLSLAPKTVPFSGMKSRQPKFTGPRIQSFFLNRAHSEAIAFLCDTFQARPSEDPNFLVHRVDLAKGKASPPVLLKTGGKILDVDPTGRRVAVTRDFRWHGAQAPQIQIWELTSPKAKLVSLWNPIEERSHKGVGRAPLMPSLETGVEFAQFVDADHLLATTGFAKLVLWEISTKRALYAMHLSGRASFALSPNRKYLAAIVETGVAMLDPLTGKTLGRIRTEPPHFASLAFRSDGKRLAALTSGHVVVWDLEKGEEYREFDLPTQLQLDSLEWVADGYVLAGGLKLIDVERRIVLWEYQLPKSGQFFEQPCGELGGTLWYPASDTYGAGVVGVVIPHAEATRKAATLDADDLLVLKPGSKVRLTVTIQVAGAEQNGAEAAGKRAAQKDQITTLLTAQLQRSGINIDPSSSLLLAATLETGKPKEQSFRIQGQFGTDVEKAKIEQSKSSLRLMEGQKVLWEASAENSSAPMIVNQRPDQPLQEAVNEFEAQRNFFASVQLPTYLARQGDGGAYGASVLSASGMKDVPVAQLRAADEEARKLNEALRSGRPPAAPLQRLPNRPGAVNRGGAPGGVGGNGPAAPTGGL